MSQDIDDAKSMTKCRLTIAVAIGLLYSMAVSGLVGWFANPWIDFPSPEIESIEREKHEDHAIHFLLLTLLSGVMVGFLAGIMRGKRPGLITFLALGTAIGASTTFHVRGWDVGGEFWRLVVAQVVGVVGSVCVCLPMLKFLQYRRRLAVASLKNSVSPGRVPTVIVVALACSSIVMYGSALVFGLGKQFLLPTALVYAMTFVLTIHLSAVYPNREPLASRLRGFLFAWLALNVFAFVVAAMGSGPTGTLH